MNTKPAYSGRIPRTTCPLPWPACCAVRARIADRGRLLGMVSQGFPQLVRVSADILRPDPTRTFPQRTPIISQVRMINEAPWIPDLERIEEMVAEETSVLVE